MDYMDPDARCPQKAVKFNHPLVLNWMSSQGTAHRDMQSHWLGKASAQNKKQTEKMFWF